MPKPGQITKTGPEPNANPPLSSLQEDDLWKLRTVTLEWCDAKPDKVPALWYGPMYIFSVGSVPNYSPKLAYELQWTPGNNTILRLDDLAGLKKVGEELFDSFPLLWKTEDRQEVISKLPDWVRPWIEAMCEDNQYYDPTTLKGE